MQGDRFVEHPTITTNINSPSPKWLMQHEFQSIEDYFAKLRIIKKSILEAENAGYIEEVTPEGQCRLDNPNHMHGYQVVPDMLGQINASFLIQQSQNNQTDLVTARTTELRTIQLGHPCGRILVYNAWKNVGSLDLIIELAQLKKVEIWREDPTLSTHHLLLGHKP